MSACRSHLETLVSPLLNAYAYVRTCVSAYMRIEDEVPGRAVQRHQAQRTDVMNTQNTQYVWLAAYLAAELMTRPRCEGEPRTLGDFLACGFAPETGTGAGRHMPSRHCDEASRRIGFAANNGACLRECLAKADAQASNSRAARDAARVLRIIAAAWQQDHDAFLNGVWDWAEQSAAQAGWTQADEAAVQTELAIAAAANS